MITASDLDRDQDEKLIALFREIKEPIRLTLEDIKGISLSIV